MLIPAVMFLVCSRGSVGFREVRSWRVLPRCVPLASLYSDLSTRTDFRSMVVPAKKRGGAGGSGAGRVSLVFDRGLASSKRKISGGYGCILQFNNRYGKVT